MSDPLADAMYLCRGCGMVRAADRPPWCRHHALDLPATRMVPLPASHPVFGESPENWTEQAVGLSEAARRSTEALRRRSGGPQA